ncbi:uromodulin-like 1 isoform 2-T2 [Clarias gariepinus]|uniref:uromodulin-like 1 isoform X2 n=1 Tax=Clarias gariepinus TaxID=13013 RepID=UPI00234CCB0C|nr:uromodulin-like 1 isoform X2 [Clarias gariepinus]
MLWTFCAWTVTLLYTCSRGHDTPLEGYALSPSGYHVCPGIETVAMTTVISHQSAYTEMTPCGGWLPWKTCNVTRYRTVYQTQVVTSERQVMTCCHGYEQLGSYCAPALNRSSEFTAKPGACPGHAVPGPGSRCHWDTDCPGWQKCCQAGNQTQCVEPQSHVNLSSWLNVTVTVKAAYSLVNTSRGIFNHTRLLHAAVTGALSSPQVSVYHTHSWSSGWLSTSSSLLLGSSQLLSMTNISNTLLHLLENLEEVMAVDVMDVDECATPVLRECSALAHCSNTLGSYNCTCSGGSADLQPSRPGTQCMSIPKIINLWAENVTSSSFTLLWDVPSQLNLTSRIVLLHGTHQLGPWETPHSHWMWTNLQPGVLYTAQVALCMCGSCGNATELKVKTDGQILEVAVRITNVNFTEALLNPNSEEYKMLSEKVRNETLHFLPSWILDLVLSGKVIVSITHLSPGSVVASFDLVFLPNSVQDINSIAVNLVESLQRSTQFTLDPNATTITDVKECALGEADCSPWAECVDTFGSYTCVCRHGYTDANPMRPGRTCQATASTSPPIITSRSTPVISTTSNTSAVNHNTSTDMTAFSSSSSSSSTASTPVTQGADGSPAESKLTKSTDSPSSTFSSRLSNSVINVTQALSSFSSSSSVPVIVQTESIEVECGPGFMLVTVLRYFLELKHIAASSLYLGEPSCSLTDGNATHVKLFVAWGMCGAQLRNNSQNSTVQVTLHSTDSRLQVPVICTYINSFIISAGYGSSGYDTINNVVEGSGMYHVTVRLLNGSYPLPQNYTLSPDDEVVVEVGLSSNMSQIKVVINKCWANPSNNPVELPNSVFFENSCPVPEKYTRVLQNGESTRSLLAVNLFNLVEFDVIYLHCQIQICVETSTATCRPGCSASRLARTSRDANVVGMAKASCGPVLKSHLEVTLQDAVWNMRTIGFVLLALGVCVLALGAGAVAMFCRRRRGTYSFRFRPREENFTYHVFST